MKLHIPYGGYWSTPFARWQGSFADLHSIELAAHVARQELGKRDIPPSVFDFGVLGFTIPQQHSFYGLPWLMGMLGADRAAGPTISQACATGVRSIAVAADELARGAAETVLVVACDRTSNGPHLYYPKPSGPGGTGDHENWVLDNFSCDPLAKVTMTETGENVARKWEIGTEAQHEVVLRRYAQYQDALADDSAFLKRFMTLPFEVPDKRYRKTIATLDGDEGIHPTTAEGLERLRPVVDGGTITFGGQTHPADGNAAIIVTTEERARTLSRDPAIAIRIVAFGQARAEVGYMPEAPIAAAKHALDAAGLRIGDVDAIKSHNPFALNDLAFAREMDVDVMTMNNYGCSLIWGHPQGPTGLRGVIELIEELALRGGGVGLFHGCAAGDTAMAVIVKVEAA
ncbi:MAG: thiolase family protein [Acidobacteriota bacterium]|nr:MAG: thiolase family protein [Acidobacteriota bacterium]